MRRAESCAEARYDGKWSRRTNTDYEPAEVALQADLIPGGSTLWETIAHPAGVNAVHSVTAAYNSRAPRTV